MDSCPIVALFCTPENRQILLQGIESILKHPAALIFYVEKQLEWSELNTFKSRNMIEQAQYRKCLQKLNDLLLAVSGYIDAVETRPNCSSDRTNAILAELNDKHAVEEDKNAVLDLEDRRKFPRTIGFMKELEIWINDITQHFNEVKELYDNFEKEKERLLSVEEEKKEKKNRMA